MLTFFRRLVLVGSTAGGAYGAFRLLGLAAEKAGAASQFNFNSESLLLVIPVCLVGAAVGALMGGILMPRDLR